MPREQLAIETYAAVQRNARGRVVQRETYLSSPSVTRSLRILRDRTTDAGTRRDIQWLLDSIAELHPTL